MQRMSAYHAYPDLRTARMEGHGRCGYRTWLQCNVQRGEHWNPMVLSTEGVQHAAALRNGHEMHTKLGFAEEWPDKLGAITELRDELELGTLKELSHCGHLCIFKEGFTWDLKRAGAYP